MSVLIAHAAPAVLDLTSLPPSAWPTVTEAPFATEDFVRDAGYAVRSLPRQAFEALNDFRDHGAPAGAFVMRGVPVGALPATPPSPTTPFVSDRTSEFSLLTVARALGQPVGYLPEHGGEIVQNIVPVRGNEHRQVSTSSSVELMFHTEAAFHPHRPRYLLLLCLRGDPSATTTLSSIEQVLPLLDDETRAALFEPRFRTAADESYVGGPALELGDPAPVLSGDRNRPTMVFDADLMVGTDEGAERAIHALSAAVGEHHSGTALTAGDLLVVDNTACVHGRSPYRPRFDGNDRWLQRTFVVSDLAPSAAERSGRVITTRFR